MKDPARLEELIGLYLGGFATAEQVAELESVLAGDDEARRLFLRHSNVDSALAGWQQDPLTLSKSLPIPTRAARWYTPRRARAVAAAVAVAIIGLSFWQLPRGIEATVLTATGAAATEFLAGESIHLEDLEMGEGTLSLRLGSGVLMDIAPMTALRFHDAMHVQLIEGSVTSDVGPEGKGFVIETERARIVDLGTRFGVSHEPEGETDVVVLHGVVEVFQARQGGERVARLSEGEAVRIDRSSIARRLAAVALDGETLSRRSQPGAQPPLVVDVRDNIDEHRSNRFYSLIPRGMAPDQRVYSTLGKPRWQPLPGESFPEILLGADVVRTFSSDRLVTDLQLTLELARPATVFLMTDTRGHPPAWLRQDFTPSRLQIQAGPWGNSKAAEGLTPATDGEVYVTYEVWQRDCDAGRVILGAPHESGDPRELAMYGIAVRARH